MTVNWLKISYLYIEYYVMVKKEIALRKIEKNVVLFS